MKLVTVAQMQEIEKEADSQGLSYAQMMENAGHGLADIVWELFGETNDRKIVGLIGPGNNGGDTLVALSALINEGWSVSAVLVKRKRDELVKQFTDAGGVIISGADAFEKLAEAIEESNVVLDGVLGTGIKLPLRKDAAELLDAVNDILDGLESHPLIIAVDCPSGVDCDTGDVAEQTIPADLTVTMAAVKQGLVRLPAFEYVGELQVVDIGLPVDLPSLADVKTEVAEMDLVAALLPDRPLESHKGTFGTAVLVAGSVAYTGAAKLAGEAAYRVGAGLVKMAVPAPLHAALAGHLPEATWILLPHEKGAISAGAIEMLAKNLDKADALLVGPGLGMESGTREFLTSMLEGKSSAKKGAGQIGFVHEDEKASSGSDVKLPPMIIDADGLRLLAQIPDWQKKLPASSILTPHPGEMSALTGLSNVEIQENRQSIAVKFAKDWGQVVVLKGAFTVVAAPNGQSTMIPVATPALARAGTGDVLAGVITGLRAQGLDAYEAAVAGAWIHAQAGLYASDDLGTTSSVLAGDVLDSLPDVLSDLE